MRILHVTDTPQGMPGGRESHILRFAVHGNAMGHANTQATLTGALSAISSSFGSKGDSHPELILLHNRDSWGAARKLRHGFPTSVILAWAHDQSFVCPASISWFRKTRTACCLPLGSWCIGNAYSKHCNARRPDRNVANYRAVRANLKGVPSLDGVIVASKYMKDRFEASAVSSQAIHVLPYFVDSPVDDKPMAEQPSRVLYVGRLNETKGVDVLVSSLSLLPEHVELVIVGGGYIVEDLRQLARNLGITAQRVTFAGPITDQAKLAALYQSAAVVAVPSLWPEPFGIVGLEAMMHGKPVVASDVGGIPEWLVDGETGLLAKPGRVDDLAAKLQRLLENKELRRRFGDRGREHVRTTFSWARHWAGFTAIVKASGGQRLRLDFEQRYADF